MMASNIVLIGFMACGKGRTARELSRKTDRYAIDSDDMIESLVKMKVRKIFSHYGEKYFRDLERKTAKWMEKNIKETVISTGGGFVNVPNINKIGIVVHLNGDFDQIIDSIYNHPDAQKKIKKRPLLNDLDKARRLYNERLPVYRNAADLEINTVGKETKQVAAKIIKKLAI